MKTNSHMEQQSTAERLTSMLSKIAIQRCAIENQKKEELDIFFGKGKMFHSIPL